MTILVLCYCRCRTDGVESRSRIRSCRINIRLREFRILGPGCLIDSTINQCFIHSQRNDPGLATLSLVKVCSHRLVKLSHLLPQETWYEQLIRYGLYVGAVFQLVCILVSLTSLFSPLTDINHESLRVQTQHPVGSVPVHTVPVPVIV